MRLRLKALAAADGKAGPVADAAAQRAPVLSLLGDATQSRRHMGVLASSAAEIIAALSAAGSAERAGLVAAFKGALMRLQSDGSLSRADRLIALSSRVQIAQLDAPGEDKTAATPAALRSEVRDIAARFDREVNDAYERQAVIPIAAWVLEQAGLIDDADALLRANLAKSHSPYYLMADLADLAKKRGDKAAALDWNAQAFDKSEGPATRLQWGARYLGALVELAPQDSERIERVARQLFDEAAAMPDAFEARSGRSLQRIGSHLSAWGKGDARGDAMKRLQQQLDTVCTKLPASEPRTLCDGMLKPASSA
jgi:hypothetical protein